MVSRAIKDKFDSWQLKELKFPRPKDSEIMTPLSYHSLNLSLIALETVQLLVHIGLYTITGRIIQTLKKNVFILTLTRNVLATLTNSARSISIKYLFRGPAKCRSIAKTYCFSDVFFSESA